MGQPDPERICTSIRTPEPFHPHERSPRLTNAFSKKWENHWAAVACWFAFYNFCRVHKSIRVTPAMAAGIADRIWTVRDPSGGCMIDAACFPSWPRPHQDVPRRLLGDIMATQCHLACSCCSSRCPRLPCHNHHPQVHLKAVKIHRRKPQA